MSTSRHGACAARSGTVGEVPISSEFDRCPTAKETRMPPGNPLPVAEGPSKTPAAPARATTPAAPATTLRTDDVPPHAPAGGAGCVAPVRPGIGVRFRRLSPSLVTLRARPPGCLAWARRRPLSAILPLAVLAGPLCALAVPLCA